MTTLSPCSHSQLSGLPFHQTTVLFASIDADKLSLQLSTPRTLPEGSTTCYFVRDPSKFITAENIDLAVFFGTLKGGQGGGDVMQSLLSSMQGMYLPVLLGNNGWPEAVRADFTGQLHKFMATLTESVHQSQGNTVLYIPKEDYGDVKAAAKQKDLVQRLESTIIHWTRQIKVSACPFLLFACPNNITTRNYRFYIENDLITVSRHRESLTSRTVTPEEEAMVLRPPMEPARRPSAISPLVGPSPRSSSGVRGQSISEAFESSWTMRASP